MAIGAGGPVGPFRSALEARAFVRLLAKDTAIGLSGAEIIVAELESIGSGRGFTFVPVQRAVLNPVLNVLGELESAVGEPLFDSLFGAALGPDVLRAMADQAPGALRMLQRVIGFTVGLPFGAQKVHDALKALMGPHAPDSLLSAVEKLPAELGMNFFIPQIMSNVIEIATGTPLREAIAEQTRPFRLEWPQLRALTRLHALDDATLRDRFRKIGVPEADIPLLLKLDQQQLPVGDLQQAYLSGIMDEAQVLDKLDQAGFTPDDAATILELYLHRAETAGGDQLRLAAQEGFLTDHLTAEQYAAILDRVHVPAQSRDLEIEAATLRKEWQQHTLTVAEIKALTVDGQLSDVEAAQRLTSLNYAALDASRLVASWHKAARAAHAGLTEAQVLAYQAHGVLTPAQAYDYLIGLGIKPADARFVVAHPTLSAPVAQRPLTQTTVIAAYLDDVIDRTAAAALLTSAHVAPAEIDLALRVADAKLAKGVKPKAPHKSLSEAQVIEAFKYGLASEEWAVRELVLLGYAQADAWLIVAIEVVKLTGKLPAGWTVQT